MDVGAAVRRAKRVSESPHWHWAVLVFLPVRRHGRLAQRAIRLALATPLAFTIIAAVRGSGWLVAAGVFVAAGGLAVLEAVAGIGLMKARRSGMIRARLDVYWEPDPDGERSWIGVKFWPESEPAEYEVEAHWLGFDYSPFLPPWVPAMTAVRRVDEDGGRVRLLEDRDLGDGGNQLTPAVVAGTPPGHVKTTRDGETLRVIFKRASPPGRCRLDIWLGDGGPRITETHPVMPPGYVTAAGPAPSRDMSASSGPHED